MSVIFDYASLVSAVLDYQDRASDTAFSARVDTFIGLAEDEWTPTLMSRQMETTASLTTASDGSVPLPADFYRYRALYATINGVQTNLPMVSPVAEQGLFPIPTSPTSQYAKIIGSTLYLIPENVVQTVTLDYWSKPVGLSGSNTTNWVIINHPTLYFYSVMEQGCYWLKDFDEASNWRGLKDVQLDEITGKLGLEYYMNTDVVLDVPTP